jgi:hypothetical protein|tara:strand:- start:208 stop:366 length:159 start_codon:yes stop_codon:yes gene_type:complete
MAQSNFKAKKRPGKKKKGYADGGIISRMKPTNQTSTKMTGGGAATRGTTIKV